MVGKLNNASTTQKALGAVVGILVLLGVIGALASVFPTASNQGYAPDQPIPFPHDRHAGLRKMDCRYCHSGVERSQHASIPPVELCMQCHNQVLTDSPLIQKLTQYYKEGRPIEWVRIHELPDFVRFKHQPHVLAGVSCQTCHGPVETMGKVAQFAPLTMGWCLNCHRGDTTPKTVLQKFYPEEEYPNGLPDRPKVAPDNCSTCHY